MLNIVYIINGRKVTEAEFDNHALRGMDLPGLSQHKGHSCSTYPMESDALGINPRDIKEQMASDRRHGVPTEYNPDTGCAKLTDPGHRKRLSEINDMFDLNGGYSDPQRGRRN